jgi:hypothetical protein
MSHFSVTPKAAGSSSVGVSGGGIGVGNKEPANAAARKSTAAGGVRGSNSGEPPRGEAGDSKLAGFARALKGLFS